MFPIVEQHSYRATSFFRTVLWGQDQHLQKGWLQARVPTYLMVRACRAQSERLRFESKNGQHTVVNGFGKTIHHLLARLPDGTIVEADGVLGGTIKVSRKNEPGKIERLTKWPIATDNKDA